MWSKCRSANAPTQSGPAATETILQDVLVLASGQTFTRPEDRSIMSRTVTLAVTPEQVDVLVAARVRGPLSLSLRGVNDHVVWSSLGAGRRPSRRSFPKSGRGQGHQAGRAGDAASGTAAASGSAACEEGCHDLPGRTRAAGTPVLRGAGAQRSTLRR